MVPKQIETNLRWRMSLRKSAQNDKRVQSSLLTACSNSPLFWMNAFGWTYRQRRVLPTGDTVPVAGHEAHIPMITWPVQDEVASKIFTAIASGEGVNAEKSRDMGLTWLVLFVFAHGFVFKKEQNYGVISRKESLVDSSGDMDSLFEKLRYIFKYLPEWMAPKVRSRYMHLSNLQNNSSIAGESTNEDVGRGGRKIAYLVDEAAAINNGQEIENSLSQTTGSQIWVSTPKGPDTQFFKRIKERRGVLVQIPWWRHPEKAVGAHQVHDELGRVRWTSPWYENAKLKMSVKAIAQEIDMDHGKSGDTFFDYTEVERHRMDHEKLPTLVGDLLPLDVKGEDEWLQAVRSMDYDRFTMIPGHGRKPWKLWIKLDPDGRPPQHHQYVFGIDISNGSGNSNSVITVISTESGMVVAKYWDAFTSPEELALRAAAAGVWFGGVNSPALIIWENNGPGGIFGRKIVKVGYPHLYRQRADTRSETKTDRWGWNSTKDRKEKLLGEYRDKLSKDRVINPCKESLDECCDYIYDQSGSLLPARLREETDGGRQLHGDHVIADALASLGCDELPGIRLREIKAPVGTFAHRQQSRRAKVRSGSEWEN